MNPHGWGSQRARWIGRQMLRESAGMAAECGHPELTIPAALNAAVTAGLEIGLRIAIADVADGRRWLAEIGTADGTAAANEGEVEAALWLSKTPR